MLLAVENPLEVMQRLYADPKSFPCRYVRMKGSWINLQALSVQDSLSLTKR
jgi:hypothetical protein